MGTKTLPQILAEQKQATNDLENYIGTAPIPFGPAVLVKITTELTCFNAVIQEDMLFQPTNGDPSFTISPQALPPGGAVETQIYSGAYTKGTGPGGTDTLTSFGPTATAFDGVLLSAPLAGQSSPPFPYTFVSVSGAGGTLTLNLAAPVSGLTAYQRYQFSYTTAKQNGTSFDAIVKGPTQG